jgi:hypothetical protein
MTGMGLLWVLIGCHRSPQQVHRPDFSGIPLSQAQYLKDVIEPISMNDSRGFDDGGSIGLVFRDSKGNEKSITLLDNLDDEHNVVFGVCIAYPKESRAPLAGDEEKALLGLLERWYRQDPNATKWNDRIERWLSSSRKHSEGWNHVWGEPLAKLRAVLVLRELRSRN